MKPTSSSYAAAASLVLSALWMVGCGFGSFTPAVVQGSALHGTVHGGQQPVAGATIQLYAAGTSGYGSAARPLIGTSVLTNASGGFSITGKYTCQSSDLLYVVATGGNPGAAGTHNNSALALMAGLGPCSGISSSTYISINELTTVASVWSLSPFMSSLANVGSSATNVTGLANAFTGLSTVMNLATGTVPGPAFPAGATLPVAEINTLADILAACVNSVDTTSPAQQSSACQALFAATTVGSSVPADTVQAAINLAQNPALGLGLGSTVGATPPFVPTLQGIAPSAWTIAINYVGGGLNAPSGLAVDGGGNVFVANSGNNSVTKLDTTGTALSGAAGFTAGYLNQPSAIAIDTGGSAWIANAGGSTVTRLSSNGSSGTAFFGGGLYVPTSLSIDAAGNVWVTNYGSSSVTELGSNGTTISGASGYVGGGLSQPVAVAIDPK